MDSCLRQADGTRVPARRLLRGLLLLPLMIWLVVPLTGCGGDRFSGSLPDTIGSLFGTDFGGRCLRIASPWTIAERQDLARRVQGEPGMESLHLVWIAVPEDLPLARLSRHAPPVDVFLGGPLISYARLAGASALLPMEGAPARYWCVARRSFVEPALPDGARPDLASPALEDPRVGPATGAWAEEVLDRDAWPVGYARLVQLYGHTVKPPGWTAGAAPLRLAPVSAGPLSSRSQEYTYTEAAAIAAGTRHEADARAFLQLIEAWGNGAKSASELAIEPEVSDLLVDLLGATLVDAREELVAAWQAVEGAGHEGEPAPAVRWLVEPPPWPPASVQTLQDRGGERALAMVHDLAGQIAPDPELRFWLMQSWLGTRRQVDRALLSGISSAVGGRLVREPRFRAWLRGEWTAWARQRYRRVARLAESPRALTADGRATSGAP